MYDPYRCTRTHALTHTAQKARDIPECLVPVSKPYPPPHIIPPCRAPHVSDPFRPIHTTPPLGFSETCCSATTSRDGVLMCV